MQQSVSKSRAFIRIVWPIAAAETLAWGGIYYLFPALLLVWEQEMGWSKAELSGAITLAALAGGAFSPFFGRWIDRGYGTWVFMLSTAAGGVLLLALSQVMQVWQFYVVSICMGIPIAGALYEPVFSILTKSMSGQARKAITQVTLAAGFASTICFPLTNFLAARIGWRAAVQVWALILIFFVMPVAWLGLRHLNEGKLRTDRQISPTDGARTILRSPLFWLLALSFSMTSLNHSMLLTHLLPIFDEKGISPEIAIFAASLIGPSQVVGRLAIFASGDRASATLIFTGCFLTMAFAALILTQTDIYWGVIFAFVVLQGAGYGITSIVRPVTTADLMGREQFGVVTGLLAIPFMGASALGPILAAVIWGWGGYDQVILTAMVIALVGLAGIRFAVRTTQ